jgi:hypothetical protein
MFLFHPAWILFCIMLWFDYLHYHLCIIFHGNDKLLLRHSSTATLDSHLPSFHHVVCINPCLRRISSLFTICGSQHTCLVCLLHILHDFAAATWFHASGTTAIPPPVQGRLDGRASRHASVSHSHGLQVLNGGGRVVPFRTCGGGNTSYAVPRLGS